MRKHTEKNADHRSDQVSFSKPWFEDWLPYDRPEYRALIDAGAVISKQPQFNVLQIEEALALKIFCYAGSLISQGEDKAAMIAALRKAGWDLCDHASTSHPERISMFENLMFTDEAEFARIIKEIK